MQLPKWKGTIRCWPWKVSQTKQIMEDIVASINRLSVQTKTLEEILKENRSQNSISIANMGAMHDATKSSSNSTEPAIEESAQGLERISVVDGNDTDAISHRRRMPARASKENLSRIQRRTIRKPKQTNRNANITAPSAIVKLYRKQSISGFRPSSLETIYEVPEANEDPTNESALTSTMTCLIGLRRLRRVVAFNNGNIINKTVIKQRRAKVKKFFGRRTIKVKFTLNDVIGRLTRNAEETEQNIAADDQVDRITLVPARPLDSGDPSVFTKAIDGIADSCSDCDNARMDI